MKSWLTSLLQLIPMTCQSVLITRLGEVEFVLVAVVALVAVVPVTPVVAAAPVVLAVVVAAATVTPMCLL